MAVTYFPQLIPLSSLKIFYGAPGWRSRLSGRLQPGHDLAVREFEPRVRLWADGSEPGACAGDFTLNSSILSLLELYSQRNLRRTFQMGAELSAWL